ncbi:hypothetical protein PIB30_000309 [Stylosanthes scabra]|uniref:Uncharacterized protein n=1 Tax=Stylosanthes scabra TaxID=79078 RepID=A0ABU6T209_9FABA|nr:hypothetical protein [Stylosanthes scabra]
MLFSLGPSSLPTSSKPPNRRRKRVMTVLAQLTRTLCGVKLYESHAGTGFMGPVESLETQGQVLQQHIDEIRSLKDILAERDARAEEHLRCMEEMSRQMAAIHNPLRPGNSATVGNSGSSTTPPLSPRPPLRQPDHLPVDDDDDYEDA